MLELLLAAQIADYEREVALMTTRAAAQAIADSAKLEQRLVNHELRLTRRLGLPYRFQA